MAIDLTLYAYIGKSKYFADELNDYTIDYKDIKITFDDIKIDYQGEYYFVDVNGREVPIELSEDLEFQYELFKYTNINSDTNIEEDEYDIHKSLYWFRIGDKIHYFIDVADESEEVVKIDDRLIKFNDFIKNINNENNIINIDLFNDNIYKYGDITLDEVSVELEDLIYENIDFDENDTFIYNGEKYNVYDLLKTVELDDNNYIKNKFDTNGYYVKLDGEKKYLSNIFLPLEDYYIDSIDHFKGDDDYISPLEVIDFDDEDEFFIKYGFSSDQKWNFDKGYDIVDFENGKFFFMEDGKRRYIEGPPEVLDDISSYLDNYDSYEDYRNDNKTNFTITDGEYETIEYNGKTYNLTKLLEDVKFSKKIISSRRFQEEKSNGYLLSEKKLNKLEIINKKNNNEKLTKEEKKILRDFYNYNDAGDYYIKLGGKRIPLYDLSQTLYEMYTNEYLNSLYDMYFDYNGKTYVIYKGKLEKFNLDFDKIQWNYDPTFDRYDIDSFENEIYYFWFNNKKITIENPSDKLDYHFYYLKEEAIQYNNERHGKESELDFNDSDSDYSSDEEEEIEIPIKEKEDTEEEIEIPIKEKEEIYISPKETKKVNIQKEKKKEKKPIRRIEPELVNKSKSLAEIINIDIDKLNKSEGKGKEKYTVKNLKAFLKQISKERDEKISEVGKKEDLIKRIKEYL